MSIVVARRKRNSLYYCIVGLVLLAAATMAISARDSDGVGLRAGMVMLTAGAAFLLPWPYAFAATLAIWLGPNYIRSVVGDEKLFGMNMVMEFPALFGLCAFSVAVRQAVKTLEEEALQIGAAGDGVIDPDTGVYEERSLRAALQAELTRSHRFKRTFAFVLVGIDEKHERFGFRDSADWQASYRATSSLLRRTRNHIDRVYLWGPTGFALILPESGEKEVTGLVRRLRKIATNNKPREGQPGGPMPVAFGATFFPASAQSVEDLIRRAEIALRLALKNPDRLQIDGAEAPAMAAPETLRHPEAETPELELPEHISDAWIAQQVERQPGAPAPVLTLVPTDELVSTMRQEAGQDILRAATPVAHEPLKLDDATESQMSDDELTQLLGRLDETLGLLRGLRAQAS
jgi:diguanylate cyclase (GGDEF)-like protein